MRPLFRYGDIAYYGAIRGLIIGVYTNTKALFLSDEPRANFYTALDLLKSATYPINDILFFFLTEYFGEPPTIEGKQILKSNRFITINLEDLKTHKDNKSEKERLIVKRHMYIKMIQNYIKFKKPEEKLDSVFSRLEAVQNEIDLLDAKNAKCF